MVGTSSPVAAAAVTRSSMSSTLKVWSSPRGRPEAPVPGSPAPNTASASSTGSSKRSTGWFWLTIRAISFSMRAQVGLGDGLGKLEVVVEAVLDGRADGVPGAREEADDRLRHDVGRGVALDVDGVGVVALERDDVEAVAVVQRRGRVDQQGDVRVGGGGDTARDSGLGQSRTDRRRRVAHGRAVVEFERGAVGKGDVQGHAGGPFSACAPAHLAGAVDSVILPQLDSASRASRPAV